MDAWALRRAAKNGATGQVAGYFESCRGGQVVTMTEEYLTIDELAARLKLKKKTVKNKMAAGIFQKGVHYFSPEGIGPRFKWSAVQAWLEGRPAAGPIPMKAGYTLNVNGLDTF
jgi:hypothetical protein